MSDAPIALTESRPGRAWLRAWPVPVAMLAAGAAGYFVSQTFGAVVALLAFPVWAAVGMVTRWRLDEQRTADVVLALLVGGSDYGRNLAERVRTATAGRLQPGQGIYPVLRDLERRGLLRSFERMAGPERAGLPRVHYALTTAGREAAELRGLRAADLSLGTTPPAGT